MNKNALLTMAVLLFLSALMASTAEAVMQVRIDMTEKSDILKIAELNLDIIYQDPETYYIDIVADQKDLDELNSAGLNYSIVHQDMTAFYQSRYGEVLDMGGYPTMEEAYDSLDLLNSTYPHIVSQKDSIGYTIEGRPIYMVKISDNVSNDEDEPELFINGLIHAREPGALLFNLYYMRYLCANYGTDPLVTELVDEREFFFVPLINPDGYEYNRLTDPNGGGMWRKNRKNNGGSYGVDLNRNWGYQWGYDDEGSSPYGSDETYRGTAPFSEPETESMRQFINSRNFVASLNYHSYGGYLLYPYGYEDIFAEEIDLFRAWADSMLFDNNYAGGTAWQLLYNTNGDACDWGYGEYEEKPRIYSFVVEIGTGNDGFWPPEYRIPEHNEENLGLALVFSQLAGNPYGVIAPSAPIIYPMENTLEDTFTVAWHHSDSANPAVLYELIEKSGYYRGNDDFEDSEENWTLDGWSFSNTRQYEGDYSLYSGQQNRAHFTASVNSPLFIQEDDELTFYTWYDIERNWDYAYVQASTDGGVTFENLEGNITTNYDPYGANQGNGITGNSNGWTEANFPLRNYEGQEIILRMFYNTDGRTLGEGMFIDELYPVDAFENSVVLASDITDTTYFVDGRDDGDYYYQARAKDEDDQWSLLSNMEKIHIGPMTSVDDEDENIPLRFALHKNYPNPFNAGTNISFTLPEASNVTLDIINILGKKVATIADGNFTAGKHIVTWDGVNSNGNPLASGFYFYRLKAEDRTSTKRMLMLK